MKMKKPKLGGHVSRDNSVNPLMRKQPDLETGLSKMSRHNRMMKDMKKVNQIADGIRVAEIISRQDKG